MSEENNQDLLGKKVRGFRFISSVVEFEPRMENIIGEIGLIVGVSDTTVAITFDNGRWLYPLEEAKKHLVDGTKQTSCSEPTNNLVGKKVRGFSFNSNHVVFYPQMEKHIGETGEIVKINGRSVMVYFKDEYWFYPLEEAKNHLVGDTEQFYKKEIISFGNYLLSEERSKSVNSVNMNHVTNADFEN